MVAIQLDTSFDVQKDDSHTGRKRVAETASVWQLSRSCTADMHGLSLTHTHSFNGPFSWTTRVGRYQKGKANLDFTEARDSEWQWHQLGYMQVCTSLQTLITTPAPHHSIVYRPDALPAAQPTASKH